MDKFDEPEGATPLEPDEKQGLKIPNVKTRAELNELEQANIEEGLLWLARQKSPDVLCEAFVRQLHVKLFGEIWAWAGQYRSSEKSIGVAPHNISSELKKLIDDARFWIENQTYPSRELVLRFHHRLVWIHCFANGNGRHARIMADAILTKIFKEKPIDWGVRNFENSNAVREKYIAALRKADGQDFSLLVEYVKNDLNER